MLKPQTEQKLIQNLGHSIHCEYSINFTRLQPDISEKSKNAHLHPGDIGDIGPVSAIQRKYWIIVLFL